MATTKHKAYAASIASALTTELNSLANGSNCTASSALDNTSDLHLYHDLTLTLGTQTARSAGAFVAVFIVPAIDGSNYDDTNEVTASPPVAIFSLDAATTARQCSQFNVPVPPALFKYFVRNATGQAFASSGNLLEYRAHSIETA
jgi:hypothetical protein